MFLRKHRRPLIRRRGGDPIREPAAMTAEESTPDDVWRIVLVSLVAMRIALVSLTPARIALVRIALAGIVAMIVRLVLRAVRVRFPSQKPTYISIFARWI